MKGGKIVHDVCFALSDAEAFLRDCIQSGDLSGKMTAVIDGNKHITLEEFIEHCRNLLNKINNPT